MEELAPLLLFILVVIGGSALKWWVQKQAAEKEAAERQAARQGKTPPSPAEARQAARPTPRRVAARPPAPGAVVVQQVIRRKTQQGTAPAPGVSSVARAALQTHQTMTLGGQTLPSSPPRAAATPARRPREAFLGDMRCGRNLARAIALAEILGPPKGLSGL
ncbi:MAG TPA: hypothetical protein VM431_13195 [Phycisphaerae bacterium]|nr:hypothetical protein [Phycisphaerae bacterium]